MPLDPRRVKTLFQNALDLPDPADRPAMLDRECGDDDELRRRLEVLLAAHDRPASALEGPRELLPGERPVPGDETTPAADPPGRPADDVRDAEGSMARTAAFRPEAPAAPLGSVIAGRYRLRQEIGEGGMGVVYLAEQTLPVRRQVALKLIKAGMDSHAVIARFESERQALALMDHPNIAKVLDAGSTAAGRPFFVMDLVKGVPLTDYCDRHRLDLPSRLALFRQVCSAVQHAHQKGVIHRDLKPSNILVESHDGKPIPKVIDFGLAKATSGLRLSEHSLLSAFGTVAGTPLYMAPEQASFNALDVDTRADIYALGVILYELLTGSTPISREAFRKAALDEMLRMVREVDPPTPSSRIGSSEGLPGIAANRHIEPSRLGRFVRGDLDWIVMKALAKERHRRYESAIAMAHDLERFEGHEPVSAGPPTTAYRLRKFVRRNRGKVVAASLVLLALVCGVVGTALGLIEADHQRGIAVARERETSKRLDQRDKANAILLSIFRDLNPRTDDKEIEPLPERLGQRLDVATDELEGEVIDDPLGVARMQMALGDAQVGLGHYRKGIALFTKARATFTALRGPDHPETLGSMQKLAWAHQVAGDLDRALPLFEETLALRRSRLGHRHPDTILSLAALGHCYADAGMFDRAVPLQEEALALLKSELGPDDPETLVCMNNLTSAYQATGRGDRALRLLNELLGRMKSRLGPDHPETLTVMNNIAQAHHAAGELDLARPLYEETLALRRSRLGPEHPDTIRSVSNLAAFYLSADKLDLAMPRLEEALTLMRSRLGPDHPDTLSVMSNLAGCHWRSAKLDRSIPLFEEVLRLRSAKSGADHPLTWLVRANLGVNYKDAGRLAEAIPLLEGAERASRDEPQLRWVARQLLDAYIRAGRTAKAAALARELLPENRATVPSGSPQLAGLLAQTGSILLDAEAWDEAEPLLRECLAIREEAEPDAWTTCNTRSMLGAALLGRKMYSEAEPLLREGYEGMKARADAIPPEARSRLREALDRLIVLAEATGKADDAKAWMAERAKLPAASAPMPEPEEK